VQSLEVLAVGSRFVAKATVGWYGAATAATRRAGAPLSAAGPAIGAPIDGGRCIAFYDVEGDKKTGDTRRSKGWPWKKKPEGYSWKQLCRVIKRSLDDRYRYRYRPLETDTDRLMTHQCTEGLWWGVAPIAGRPCRHRVEARGAIGRGTWAPDCQARGRKPRRWGGERGTGSSKGLGVGSNPRERPPGLTNQPRNRNPSRDSEGHRGSAPTHRCAHGTGAGEGRGPAGGRGSRR